MEWRVGDLIRLRSVEYDEKGREVLGGGRMLLWSRLVVEVEPRHLIVRDLLKDGPERVLISEVEAAWRAGLLTVDIEGDMV